LAHCEEANVGAAKGQRQAEALAVTGDDISTKLARRLQQAKCDRFSNSCHQSSTGGMRFVRQASNVFNNTEVVRVTDNHSSSYDEIGLLLDRSPIAVVSDPGQGKQYLLKRLLMAFVTGNGDLHMENMSLLQRNGKVEFSPVYDPTPMRAYSRHNMLVPMPFGDYGEYAGSEQPVDFETALLQLTRSLGVSRPKLRAMIEEVLAVTKDYTQRVAALVSLPDNNRKLLIGVSEMIRKKLEKF
jgi:serine/threonine-protein kinase HipA